MSLTRKQREVLNFLVKFTADRGYAPTFSETAAHFGYKSLATVAEHFGNLERRGYIRRTHYGARSVEVLPSDEMARAVLIPVLGYIGSSE